MRGRTTISEYPKWREGGAITMIGGMIATLVAALIGFSPAVEVGAVVTILGMVVTLAADWVWKP